MLNKAIQVQWNFIAFLDVDDLWFPEKLTQIPLFENVNVGLVYSDAIWFNSENGKIVIKK